MPIIDNETLRQIGDFLIYVCAGTFIVLLGGGTLYTQNRRRRDKRETSQQRAVKLNGEEDETLELDLRSYLREALLSMSAVAGTIPAISRTNERLSVELEKATTANNSLLTRVAELEEQVKAIPELQQKVAKIAGLEATIDEQKLKLQTQTDLITAMQKQSDERETAHTAELAAKQTMIERLSNQVERLRKKLEERGIKIDTEELTALASPPTPETAKENPPSV